MIYLAHILNLGLCDVWETDWKWDKAWPARAVVRDENDLTEHWSEEERIVGVGLESKGTVQTVILFYLFTYF